MDLWLQLRHSTTVRITPPKTSNILVFFIFFSFCYLCYLGSFPVSLSCIPSIRYLKNSWESSCLPSLNLVMMLVLSWKLCWDFWSYWSVKKYELVLFHCIFSASHRKCTIHSSSDIEKHATGLEEQQWIEEREEQTEEWHWRSRCCLSSEVLIQGSQTACWR